MIVLSAASSANKIADDVADGLSSYVVAEAWLLRENELANAELGDVRDVTGETVAEDAEQRLLVVELSPSRSASPTTGVGELGGGYAASVPD